MFLRSFLVILFLSFLMPATGTASNNARNMIAMLNQDLKQCKSPKEKSTLLIYRARQYSKIKEWDKSLEDYNDALNFNHKGWIHLERGHFLIRVGRYDLAYEDAEAAKEEVPTLGEEADKIMAAAVAEIRKKYEADNPLTIVMNTKVDPYRKTRFDIMREQGAFLARVPSSNQAIRNKYATKTTTSSACKPTKKRG